MKLTAKDIASLIDGELQGNPETLVTGAAGLEEAGPDDVSFLGNKKYLKQISSSKSGLLILPKDIADSESGAIAERSVVKVKNSLLAYAKILEIIEKEQCPPSESGFHPAAVISESAKIGKNVTIGPLAVIEDNAVVGDSSKILAHCFVGRETVIGSDCIIYPRVTIREKTIIGNNVIIHPGVVIGADGFGFAQTDNGHYKIPQIGTVEIQDNVEIGANVTIDRSTTNKTVIGRGTKIDNLVQIAHNCQIGENCIIVASASIAGSTKIGNNVIIAGQAGVIGHLSIGDGAVVAGQAGVMGDIKPGETVSGYPARPHKESMKVQAIIQKLPEIYEQYKKIKENK